MRRTAGLLTVFLLALATAKVPQTIASSADRTIELDQQINALCQSLMRGTAEQPTAVDLIGVMDELQADPTPDQKKLHSQCALLFEAACNKGGHYDDLTRIFSAFPLQFKTLHATFYRSIGGLAIRRTLKEGMKGFPRSAKFQPSPRAMHYRMPSSLSPDLKEGWQEALAAWAPFAAWQESLMNQPRKEYYGDDQTLAFWHDVDALLSGRSKKTAKDFLAYQSGDCVATDDYFGPQSVMVFLALLQEGRYDLAVGAALNLKRGASVAHGGQLHPEKFLAACGLDHERLIAGALLAGDTPQNSTPSSHPFAWSITMQREELLLALSADRSLRSARFLMEIIPLIRPEEKPAYLRTLMSYLPPEHETREYGKAIKAGDARTQKEIRDFMKTLH